MTGGDAMSAQVQDDPLVSFCFAVQIGGAIAGFFTECSGIGNETEVIEYKIVIEGKTQVVRKIPGRIKWSEITLKRGVSTNKSFWDWRNQVMSGKVKDARQNGSIMMYDQGGNLAAQWNFTNAWPSKITWPSLKSDGNEVIIEEITIVHEGIVRSQ